MKKKIIMLTIFILIIICKSVGINAYASQRYMSDEEAKYFLSFIFNCNYEYDEIKNDSFFKMLTGQIDNEASNNRIKLTFLTVMETQINQQIDNASYNSDILRSDLQKFLEEQLDDMVDLPEQEYNAFYNKELGYLKDDLIDWGSSIIARKAGIYITENVIDNIKLVGSAYNDVIGAQEKAKKYADYVINAIKTCFLPLNEELVGRYTYFSCYIANRKAYGYDPVFDIIYDYNKLAIMQNYPLGTIDWYPGTKDSWIEHIDDIERWGDFVIQIENSITSSDSSSGETGGQYYTITFDSNCDEIPNETRTYDLSDENYDFPEMERPGYVFGGWYADKECTRKPELSGTSTTVYAKWIRTQFKITLNSNCSETENYSYTYDVEKGNWIDPYTYTMERPGYAFLGWYKDAACTEPLTGTITIDRDLTFYAKWKRQFTYKIENGKATITDFLGTVTVDGVEQTDIVIPSTIDGYIVAKIASAAFYYDKTITSITIPDSVISIEHSAFSHCDSLTNIDVDSNNEVYASMDGVLFNKSKTELIRCPGGKTGEYIVPDSVTNIVDYAFLWCSKLTVVTIPDSVTSIGDAAFNYCGLTSVTIGNSVTSIGDSVFDSCQRLTSVTIGNSVKSIGLYAFRDCDLTSITIPDSVTNIGDCAFMDCYNLTSVTIPDSVTSIGYNAFSQCGLTSITIPDSVTNIGDCAFSGCNNLTSATIPDSVTSIGFNMFSRCGLTSITIPDSVTNIDDEAFSGCINLTSITIPDSVSSIGAFAFSDCGNLASITIPDSVTSIGYCAFSGCGLTSITIPDSVSSIGVSAFSDCYNLTSITVDSNNNTYTSMDGVLFNKSKTELLYCLTSKSGEYIIPDGVTSIGNAAFSGCDLTSVTIPDSVTSIGRDAFAGCYNLKSIMIPDSITEIDAYTFYCCRNLTDVYYDGSKEDWEKINISSYNQELTNATIHYNALPADIQSAVFAYDNGRVMVNVKFSHLMQNGMLFLAVYDGGRMITAKTMSATTDCLEYTFEFDADESYIGCDVKVFFWENTLKPLSKAYETIITEG